MANQVTLPKRTGGARLAEGPVRRGGRVRLAVALAAGVILLSVVASLTYGLAFYDNIYPNVYVGGQALGGKSQTEAAQLLNRQMRDAYAHRELALTVEGQPLTLSSEQVGLRFQAEASARRAHDYGRTGGFFNRVRAVVSSLFAREDLPLDEEFYIDRAAVEATVSRVAQLVDIEPEDDRWTVTRDAVIVTVGTPGRRIDQTALTDFICERFITGDFSPADARAETALPLPVDLTALYEEIHVEAQNARFASGDPSNIKILDAVVGVSFDQAAAQELRADAEPGAEVRIPLVRTQPSMDAATLEARLFADELASFTTYLNAGNVPRATNIRLSASMIDGSILMPGDEFSYNKTVGQRTTDRGFKQAGAYVQGKLVDEVGGGICQMSTTLYIAAVRADLKIVERTNHSMTVDYVPVGHDATVNWGSLDLRFQNDKDYPIKIQAEQRGGSVEVTLLGTKIDDHTVSLEQKFLSTRPFTSQTTVNPALAPGARKVTVTGHTGYTVETYRVIQDASGQEISRTLEAKNVYNKVDQVIEVGPDADTATTAPENSAPPADNPVTPDTSGTTSDPPDSPLDNPPNNPAGALNPPDNADSAGTSGPADNNPATSAEPPTDDTGALTPPDAPPEEPGAGGPPTAPVELPVVSDPWAAYPY
ncbi:MAG: VanW family protein [Oscillospiraceae bacterium]|jgi:vancomycin resistance protein YoaR|nr:VanW family protein [Oscillospiraceae bacterium]